MPDIWLAVQTRCFSIRPFWLRPQMQTYAAYSLAQNRRGSLGRVDGQAKYTEKRICRAVLGVDCCERTSVVERITQRISQEDHIREAKNSVGAQGYDTFDPRFTHRSCT